MKRRGEDGQALVIVALGLTVLLLAAGLGIDMGYLRYQKRRQQSAADSAAIAGASEIKYGDVTQAAQTDAATNGFTDGSNNVTVTVYNPPNDGPHQVAGYVEVLVTKIYPTFFAGIAGFNKVTVTARAVACLTGVGARNAVYTLGQGAANGLLNNGGGGVNVPYGGIIDNGYLLNNGTGATINAASIGLVGKETDNGGSISPVVKGIVPAADPLSYLQPPTPVGGCIPNPLITGGGTFTLVPGNYCTGITVTGSANIILTGGMYTITGGSVIFNGTGTVSGTGVTLYLGPSGGSLIMNGLQTFALAAPITGNYAGILFYQNPSNTSMATINGAINSQFEGALYFPTAQLTINGTGSKAAYTIAVARSLVNNGNSMLNFPTDYSSLSGGSPIKNAILGE